MNMDRLLSPAQRRAARGCLNEYLNGLKDSPLRPTPPADKAEFFALMENLKANKHTVVNGREFEMIECAVEIAITEIKDWEFSTRLGRSKQEILEAFDR
jgi:hypothetical protein